MESEKENWFIRMYFYVMQGLLIVNNFRNLVLGIFGLYVILKFTNPLWLILMFIVSLPILIIIGWYNVHRMAKPIEKISMEKSTHYAIKQYNYQERQTELLQEISDKLK